MLDLSVENDRALHHACKRMRDYRLTTKLTLVNTCFMTRQWLLWHYHHWYRLYHIILRLLLLRTPGV